VKRYGVSNRAYARGYGSPEEVSLLTVSGNPSEVFRSDNRIGEALRKVK